MDAWHSALGPATTRLGRYTNANNSYQQPGQGSEPQTAARRCLHRAEGTA